MSSSTSHILLVSLPAWGHLRPLVGLACKLVQKHPGCIIATIPVCGEFKGLVEKEINRHLSSEDDKSLIHIISLGGEGKSVFDLFPVMSKAFESFYTSLHSVAPIKCATGRVHTFTQAPNVVIADFFFLEGVHFIRKITQRKVPILCFNSAAVGPAMRIIGPEALGGLGDLEAKAKALAEKTGKSEDEAKLEVFYPQAGEVVLLPGMPPMYDYEFYPNESNPEVVKMQIPLHKQAFQMLHECDGIISATSPAFEPEGCKATEAWFAETNRPMYSIGPILPKEILQDSLALDSRKMLSADDQLIVTFLDKIDSGFGKHSLIYISFGSVFWPPGESIWNVIGYILDNGIPLLLSYDEPRLGKIPEHISKKFKDSDRALTSLWTPQQTVLQHRATGWFVTHCGHNSMMEAVIQGVPMIAWPMDAEQPATAAYVSVGLNIAYEIVEARSGLGLKPMYRGITPKGTLAALQEEIKTIVRNAFGEDGKKKRENARILKDKMRAGLEPGGDCFVEFERLIGDYLSV